MSDIGIRTMCKVSHVNTQIPGWIIDIVECLLVSVLPHKGYCTVI